MPAEYTMQWTLRAILLGAFVLAFCLSATMATAALPSAVASRVKSVNSALEQTEKALDAKQLTTAQRKLKEAQRYQKEIEDRYGGKFDVADPEYKAMADRLAAVVAKVEAAEKAAAEGAAAGQQAKAANEAICRQWVEKLKPFVDHKSDQYLRIGSDLNNASPEDQAKSRAAYAQAKTLMDEYKKAQFAEKTTDLQNVESQVLSAMKYYARDEADSAQEAGCKEWVDTLGPFVEVGRGSRKYLITSATADPEQIKAQQALFQEAGKLFDEYRKVEFPKGKTQQLQDIENLMVKTMEEMPKALAQSQAMIGGDVGKRLDAILEYLGKDTGWRNDTAKKPPTIMERDLKPVREEIDRYAGTVKPDDAKLVELRKKLETIVSTDAEHRVVWSKRTFQAADGYAGAEMDQLKKTAEAAAAAAYPKGEILRVTIPSKEWAIEDVIEPTDTTNTALRHRVTRSVRAQVAVKDANGNVWLQEVFLGQDRTPDGGWAAMKAHTTWADRMDAANVGKSAP